MIDSIAIIESDRIERMTMLNAESSFLLLEEGRKTEAVEISTHCGGGAVNTAVAMSRLGLDVATLIKLGQDARAETILARLLEEGVSTRWVVRDKRLPTGASVLISSHDRNAAVFTFRGANTLLEHADLRDEAFAVDLVYAGNLSNESADCYPEIVARAKANGALLTASPGIRQLTARGRAFLECIGDVGILAINAVEANALVATLAKRFGEGGPALELKPGEQPARLAARGLTGGGFEMSLRHFFRTLIDLGIRRVLLTDGAGGAFSAGEGEILYCPALKATVAGTAGSGDAFAATYATYTVLGQPAKTALRAATINAASVLAYVDTQTGLMTKAVIDKRLEGAREELPIRAWPL